MAKGGDKGYGQRDGKRDDEKNARLACAGPVAPV